MQPWWTSGLLVLAAMFPPAEALALYDPVLCYILDGFLGLYGLFITGMFIKEKFFRTKATASEEKIYSELRGQDADPYAMLKKGDPEKGRNRWKDGNGLYEEWREHTDGEYKELPGKKDRQRKTEQVYQGLSSATRDTYDSLHMQQLPARERVRQV